MTVNALELPTTLDERRPPGFRSSEVGLRELLGGERVGMTVFELPPGERATPITTSSATRSG